MRDDPAIPRPRIALVAYDGVSAFELGVACEVFGTDHTDLGVPRYRLDLCAARPGPVTSDAGFLVDVPCGLGPLRHADTVIVLPTNDVDRVPPRVLDALRRAHRRGARLVSLCTGAFVLAETGLLDGRRATTHWSAAAAFEERYPSVQVDPDVLYVDAGDILTSAGVAASIDLCLYLVRGDHGADAATRLARDLVVPLHRDGGQAQFIDAPMPAVNHADPIASALAWAEQHLDGPIAVDDIAARATMSPRTFARRFKASTGSTPHRWLVRQRVALAQRLLETTDLSIDLVATKSGLGTAANLRKHFREVVRTSPNLYRRAFQAQRPMRDGSEPVGVRGVHDGSEPVGVQDGWVR